MAQNVTIDDRDSILNYSPGWFRTGTYNASSTGQTGTLASSSVTAGVNVTFVFPNPATEFFYFGVKRCCGGSYLICIDCDPNNRQFETINAVDTTDNGKNPPVVLYSRKFDEPGVHEVILANQPDPAFGGNSQITLDKFLLTVPDPAAIQTVYASSATSADSTALPSVTGTKQASSSSNPLLAPILAGVLGGLAVLLILLGIWLLLRRRSRRPAYSQEQGQASTSGLMTQTSSESFRSPTSQRTTSRFTAFSSSDSAATLPTLTSSRREVDAGRIDNYLSPDDEDTLPPEYGQVFHPNPAPRADSHLSLAEPEPSLAEQPYRASHKPRR